MSRLEAAAASLRARASRAGAADAATAGARLSGRMVASLPLAFLFLVPNAIRSDIDVLDLSLFLLGGGLIAIGVRWIARCNPPPPGEAPVPVALREIAALLRTGLPLARALDLVARDTRWSALRRAGASYGLGLSWTAALRRESETEAIRLAAICSTARRVGGAAATSLERMAADLLEADEQRFEKRLRMAPVLMVLPLVLCVLPGFGIVTLGPFLRRLVA